MLDGRGSGIVLQPDTVRWFTERSSQNLADLSTSTRWVQYLDRTGDLVYREERTWTYTVLGHVLPGAARRLRHRALPLRRVRLRLRSHDDSATVRFVSGREETADLVVFADGITSVARERLDPTPDCPTPATSAGAAPSPSATSTRRPARSCRTPSPTTWCRNSHITMYPIPGENGLEPGRPADELRLVPQRARRPRPLRDAASTSAVSPARCRCTPVRCRTATSTR